MSCKHYSPLLSAFVDSELSASELAQVRDHLSSCTACQFEADRLSSLKSSLSGLHMFEPPVGLEDRLHRTVFTSPRISRSTWTLVGLLAASSVAGAYLAVHLATPKPIPEAPIAQQTTHELQVAADRAYLGGSDPISGGVTNVSVSYAGGH